MKFLIVLASIVLAINAATDRELWLEFKQNHGRNYRNLREEQARFTIFQDNLRTIEKHNELYASGEKSYHMGINQFSDMTDEEFKTMLTYSSLAKPARQEPPIFWHPKVGVKAEDSINWGSKGVVTEVKDQGQCGCSWAFSATGALEGVYAVKYGELVSFSEQNLLDCTIKGNKGCDGGVAQFAYDYIRDNGIETESDYAYEAKNGSCRFEPAKSVTKVSRYMDVSPAEGHLSDSLSVVGPVAVEINANYLQHYSGGIFDEEHCSDLTRNHAALVTGYGNANDLDYWLVKNSWGTTWGESGYFRIARNKGNQCGIASQASFPIL